MSFVFLKYFKIAFKETNYNFVWRKKPEIEFYKIVNSDEDFDEASEVTLKFFLSLLIFEHLSCEKFETMFLNISKAIIY